MYMWSVIIVGMPWFVTVYQAQQRRCFSTLQFNMAVEQDDLVIGWHKYAIVISLEIERTSFIKMVTVSVDWIWWTELTSVDCDEVKGLDTLHTWLLSAALQSQNWQMIGLI